ncbi:hypothetical protein ACLX1H_010219 [Fusarium chlamydosporum]
MKTSFAFVAAFLAGDVLATPSFRSVFGLEKRQAGRCGTGFGGVCAAGECCSSAGLIRRMARDGHQIASHTWSHQRLTTLSKAKFWNQMIFNEIAFADILGYFPTYMRPPYSASNATTDAWLGELGYHVTYFNLDTEGYLHDSPNTIDTSKQIWDSTVEGKSPASNKWLAIEHDPVYQSVYNLTEYMLKSLKRNNFRGVTVGECLEDPKANWYRQ